MSQSGATRVVMSDDLSFLSDRVRQALSNDEQVLNQLEAFDDEYAELQRVVTDLPKKTHHEIMVPFTDVAFFPGRLVHTNELTVLLGSDLYAERSASQTLEIIGRRREMLAEKIEGATAGADAMGARLGALDAVHAADGDGEEPSGSFEQRQQGRALLTTKPDGTVEITEEYANDEDFEGFGEGETSGTASVSGRPFNADQSNDGGVSTGKELDDFIARLEALEAAGEGDREGDDGMDEDNKYSDHVKDSDDDSDYDERVELEKNLSADGDAGVNRLATWKKEQAALAAAKRQKREPVNRPLGDNIRRTIAVGEVTERAFGVGSGSTAGGNTGNGRPMSKFKMRQLRIEPEDD